MSAVGERLRAWQQRSLAYWNSRAPRERRMLCVAGAVVVLGLFYVALVDSALSGRSRLEKRLPQLRQQAMLMQGLSREVAVLSSKASGATPAVTKQGVEASLAGRALRAQNVAVTDGTVRLRLQHVQFASLASWLDEVHKSMRLTVVEATVVAQEQRGMVEATLTLRQQKD